MKFLQVFALLHECHELIKYINCWHDSHAEVLKREIYEEKLFHFTRKMYKSQGSK
jgi:hypothetical protein